MSLYLLDTDMVGNTGNTDLRIAAIAVEESGRPAPAPPASGDLRFRNGTSKVGSPMVKQALAIPPEHIARSIRVIRGQKVILDADLSALYGTSTKNLNKAVRRNQERFPEDFMFQLSDDEFGALRFQFGTSKGRGGRRYAPLVFTEHGAIMAASVLNTPRAIEVSVFVVRAFVNLRELAVTHKELSHKLTELERKVAGHDEAIHSLVSAIRQLMASPPATKRGKIGFGREHEQ